MDLVDLITHEQRSAGGGGPDDPIVVRIRAMLLPVQRAVIDDPSRRKSCMCPRRVGKNVMAHAYLITFCQENPGARCVFGTMTLKKAKQIILSGKDGIQNWNKKYNLGLTINFNEGRISFPNGSRINIYGFETDADIDKIRGEPFDLIVLDECYSFPPALFDELIEQAIEPTLLDTAGTLLIMGTPGGTLDGTFYRSTSVVGQKISEPDLAGERHAICRPWKDRDKEVWQDVTFKWSFHSWSIADNTAHKVKRGKGRNARFTTMWEEVQITKKQNGWSDSNPIWRREYLGEWVADRSYLVYGSYNEDKCSWDPVRNPRAQDIAGRLGLPPGHDWMLGIGADLGFDNLTAMEVFAWCDDLPIAYHVWEDEAPGLTVGGVAAMYKRIKESVFGPTLMKAGAEFAFMVADSGNLAKGYLATLANEHGILFEPANRQEKISHVEIMNSEMTEGRLFILRQSSLADEMKCLPWDVPRAYSYVDKGGAPLVKKAEARGFVKDHCDAALYCVTQLMHRYAKEPIKLPKPGDDSFAKWEEDMEMARAFAKPRRELDGYHGRGTLDGNWGQWDIT